MANVPRSGPSLCSPWHPYYDAMSAAARAIPCYGWTLVQSSSARIGLRRSLPEVEPLAVVTVGQWITVKNSGGVIQDNWVTSMVLSEMLNCRNEDDGRPNFKGTFARARIDRKRVAIPPPE